LASNLHLRYASAMERRCTAPRNCTAPTALLVLLALLLAGCQSLPLGPLPRAAPPSPTPSFVTAPIVAPADPDAVTLVTWNLGMADADAQSLAAQIAAFAGVDLWALQETNRSGAAALLEAAAEAGENADFAAVLGESGDGIPLLTLYDADRFTLVEKYELDPINTTGRARAPLVLHLRDNRSGAEFLLVNNHLYRTRDAERHTQARLLNLWATTQTLPMLAAGDYNFDWDWQYGETQEERDAGYDAMTRFDRWQWVRPAQIVPTECSDTLPCTYDDVLDFIFVAGSARTWPAESTIIVRPGDFPDDSIKSDHRPVMGTFYMGGESQQQ
jgi:endonuclease/exonuclease/phosphatase family metal-dependent hydrolase